MSDAQSEDTLDAMLVEAIRSDPMDVVALDGLVHRHGTELLQRCRRLTGNRDAADDLMQETWCRVLAARHRLDPDRGVAGYLLMTAKNLWRDWNRTARRGHGGSVRREQSLDASWSVTEQSGGALADVLPDPQTLDRDELINRGMDLARGLCCPATAAAGSDYRTVSQRGNRCPHRRPVWSNAADGYELAASGNSRATANGGVETPARFQVEPARRIPDEVNSDERERFVQAAA